MSINSLMEAAPQLNSATMAQMRDAALLAAIVESSDDAIISKDLNGHILSWNGAAERLFGYPAASVLGKPISMLAPSPNTSEMPDILHRIRGGERVDHYETERLCRDGRLIYISLSASPIRDRQGEIIGVSTIARNITERRNAETARQMQRRILELVAEDAPLADVLHNICLTAEFELPGTTCLVLLATPAEDLLHVAAAPNLPKWYLEALQPGLPIGPQVGTCGTAAYRREPVYTADLDTDPAWTERKHLPLKAGYRACWSLPILSESGRVLGTFAAYSTQSRQPTPEEADRLRDLLHLARIAVRRSQDEAAVRASEARFRAIFELAAVGIATADLNGRFTTTNHRLAEITGYSQQQLAGMTYLDVTHPEDRTANLSAIQDLFTGAISALDFEKRYVRKDGGIVWVRTTVSLVRDDTGRPLHTIAIIEDITARRQAEELARENETRYRFLAEAIPQVVWMADDQGQLTYVNQQWHTYTGLSWAETLERGWTFPVHPDDQPRVFAEALRSAEQGVAFDTEYRLRRADGEYRWHLARATRFTLSGQQRWLGTAVDIEERQRSETALQVERERLQLALDAARMGTWEWDVRTGKVTWSHQLQVASGVQSAQFGGTYDAGMSTVHPDDFERVQQAVDHSLNDNAPYDVEYRTLPSDGPVRWIQGKGRLVLDAKGEPAKLMGVAMDITSRKSAEAEAERISRMLERTMASISESFISLDRDWRFVYVNDRVVERGGIPREKLIGQVIWDVFPKSRDTLLWQEYHRVMEEREPRLFEITDARLATSFPYEVHAYPTDEGMCAYIMNISARKSAEQELKEREAFYRSLGDAVPDFIWVCDERHRAIYVNQGWTNYTGKTLADLQERGVDWFCHPDEAERFRERWQQAERDGGRFEAEFRYRRHDGRYCWFMGRAVALRDDDGRITQWVGTCTDIHKRKEAEEALRRYNVQLEEFAFAAAHDLQEPLRNVSIYSEMLTRRMGDRLQGQEREFLNLVRGGALRMSALVRDLLLYTRAIDGHGEAPVNDSAAAVQDVVTALSQSIKSAGAAVSHDSLPVVAVQHSHLVQIFQNLISNAIKYRSPERAPHIDISAALRGLEWQFAVKDNGIGIHPDYHDRVFGLFKRLHGQSIEGTGIGLTIVKRLVEHYGGRIWVDSLEGQGATFCFTLPAPSTCDQDPPANPS